MSNHSSRSALSGPIVFGAASLFLVTACAAEENLENEASDRTAPDQTVSAACQTYVVDNNMTVEISEALCRTFEQHKNNPDHSERVLITLGKDTKQVDFPEQGFEVLSRTKNLPIVVGNVTADGLRALTELEGIDRIEPDGEMRIPEGNEPQ